MKNIIIKNIVIFGGVNAILNGILLVITNIKFWYLWLLACFITFCIGFLLAVLDFRTKKKYLTLKISGCWFLLLSYFIVLLIFTIISILFSLNIIANLLGENIFLGWIISLHFILPFNYKNIKDSEQK